MSDFVLVHGLFHGGWCWRELAARLRACGHRVYTPSLTGLGDRAHLLSDAISLDTHINDVCSVIETEELDHLVLVGHSYGGMPVTGAADRLHQRVRSLVYLDAALPENGQSVASYRQPSANPLPGPDRNFCLQPFPASTFGLDGALEKWVNRRMTPQPYGTLTQPIQLTGKWQTVVNKMYLRCNYPAPYFERSFQASSTDLSWITQKIDVGHNMMMLAPEKLHDILVGVDVLPP